MVHLINTKGAQSSSVLDERDRKKRHEEEGHKLISQGSNDLWNYLTFGFSGSSVLIASGIATSNIPGMLGLLCLTAGSVGVAKWIKSEGAGILYDHEYSRECWEHEMSPECEVGEYVDYAETMGIASKDIEVIAGLLVSHPKLSVPYHLAFEIGMLQPSTYKRSSRYAFVSAFGFCAGALLSFSISFLVKSSVTKSIDAVFFASCIAANTLLSMARYYHLRRLKRFKAFIFKGLLGYAALLAIPSFTKNINIEFLH